MKGLKHLLLAAASVLLVVTGVMLWSKLEYGDGFPDFHQFGIYSASAFALIALLIAFLLARGASYTRALPVLLLSGFAIFLAVGTCRFLFEQGDRTWLQAISGPAALSTSLVVNGGFLSMVATLAYILARATGRARRHTG